VCIGAWNSINIQFPSAVSVVRVNFSASTDAKVKSLLAENEKVLKLIRSEILQTEVRVLYELLYILNNSYRSNKTFKGLKQVEQCINRLKIMKLDAALQELMELCPTLNIKAGEGDVPSQPFLEWLCLKVLGAGQLMACALSRCSRAFILSKQQMKLEEFVVLNTVITSMLSRLWVIFRGILVSLSTLYQHLLVLLRDVASAQPMPFLTVFTLPADMTQLLDPSGAVLLTKHLVLAPEQEVKGKVKEDLGMAVERGAKLQNIYLLFISTLSNNTVLWNTKSKRCPQKTHKTDNKQVFKKVREAETFTDLMTRLEEMITWCTSRKMKKEKRLLTFLQWRCKIFTCWPLFFYRALCSSRWATLPRGSLPRRCLSSAAIRRRAHLTACFHSLRSQLKSSALRAGVKTKRLKTRRRRTELPVCGLPGDKTRKQKKRKYEASLQASNHDSHDDIDDIFAYIGM
uniref:Nucleolus and neural progenitor protein-like N-terminal domain-containing protein n=1 Tax=Mola mola TaxID=94237 RepID=A0A3Q3VZX3_MOLML